MCLCRLTPLCLLWSLLLGSVLLPRAQSQTPVPLYRVDGTDGLQHYLTVAPGDYGSKITSGSWNDNVPQGYAYPGGGGGGR